MELLNKHINKVFLYKLENIYKGYILERPSKHCRSPYVADVIINDKEYICHAPSLGCCGYSNKEQYVYLVENKNPKKCFYIIHLACRKEREFEYLIGIHPKSAEHIVNICLQNGLITSLSNLKNLEREKCFLNSRFDFICDDKDNRKTIIEVKNVPCADYEDIEDKIRKKMDFSHRDLYSKVAYFPDGYRKKKSDTVSPRALKHIQELQELKELNPETRTIIIFVIQRPDVEYFQASNIDPIYKNALNEAYYKGVEVIPIKVCWEKNGECYYNGIIPFHN